MHSRRQSRKQSGQRPSGLGLKPESSRGRTGLLAVCLMLLSLLSAYSLPSLAADAANRQQAIDMALQQTGGDGKVLGVQTDTDNNGQTFFAVKILSNGRIRIIRIRQAN